MEVKALNTDFYATRMINFSCIVAAEGLLPHIVTFLDGGAHGRFMIYRC